MVIAVRNGLSNPSSNLVGAVCITHRGNIFGIGINPTILLSSYWKIFGQTMLFKFGMKISLGERKL